MDCYFGIDAGGTQVKWAVVNADYHIEEHGSIPTCTSPADQVIETFRSVIEPHRARVRGVGFSMPGVFSEGDSDGACYFNHLVILRDEFCLSCD